MQVMIDQFKRPGKMITICNHHFGMVGLNRDDNPLSLLHRVNLFAINYNSYVQETEQYLFFAGDNNIVGFSDKFFISLSG